ncbi:ATP-dependent DNA helicase Q-like 5 [Euphorbia peplus]|nr:ATP-dependent DNA helicase Q-like 5 [Euphorbia peplus]
MDSDSDSDGSHISATPPRPSSSPPPPPTLPSSRKSKTRLKSEKPPPPLPQHKPPSKPSPLSASPFHILRPLTQTTSAPISASIETLPAGYFSKSASFSKLQRSSLNFESENDSAPRIPPGPDSANKQPNPVKRHLNLIGANAPLPPAKLRHSSAGEGNFVKLNLNNKYRKFKNRRGGKVTNKNFYRRSQRKGKSVKGGAADEEEFVSGCVEQKAKQVEGYELIEAAVLAARNEGSDENLSTMLVLPTGAGKSLCYQIPAMVLPGITLVVSPLVALMIDQLKQLPHSIHGGLLCSSQTSQEAAETLSLVQTGGIKVLFVSPERFLNAEFLSIFSATSISLLVVDEAHCVSEWSHNFRPSYMRLRASMLRAKLNVGCILAMTATATTTTLTTVMSALEIHSTNLIHRPHLRDNLQLSVSSSGNRMKDLLWLIKSPPFLEVKSIIIYCKFQYETDIISSYLCDNNISAKSYNSAILSKDRRRVQELFCSNKIRVVVATVAFGMGLDKRDVGAVIHYSLPESLEEYVQEIGRAGRDGRLSYCHLFYDDITYYKLRSLMHSDGVDEYAVSKFLHQVFDNNVHGKICSIIKESASRTFDMKEEVMLTLLTQLELGEVQYLSLLPELNVTCILNFYKTSPSVLADKDIVVSAILKKSETKQGQYVFDVPTVANSIGVTTVDLSNHLQNLKSKGEITYEVKDLAYCYSIIQVPVDFCSLSAHLTTWLSEVERVKVGKLDAMFDAAVFAVNKCEKMEGCNDAHHTPCLHKKILDYFKEENQFSSSNPNKIPHSSPFLRADIKVFVQSNLHAKFTPRAIARIMHGIASPAYPSSAWSKTHFWGRYVQTDFRVVMEAAKSELVNSAGKDDRHAGIRSQ